MDIFEQQEELYQRQFQVVKFLANNLLEKKKIYYDLSLQDFQKKCSSETYDIVVLYGVVCEKIEAYNSKIQAKQTRIENMKYSRKYFASDLFNGLNIDTQLIDKLLKENPDTDPWDIYKKIIHRNR